MDQYNIIFDGTISDGYRLDQVKGNLASLLKVDVARVEGLFLKKPVILKKGLNYESAIRYSKVLLKTGAVCRVRPSGGSTRTLPVEKAAPPDPTAQALKQATPPSLPKQTPVIDIAGTVDGDTETLKIESSEKKSGSGIGDIIAGLVLIGIGFLFGGSVFLGNPGPLDYLFDGLGIFWIAKGIYRLIR